MESDRRRHRRFKLPIPVTVNLGGSTILDGMMIDLSSGGLAVMVETDVKVGRRVHFCFELHPPRVLCETTGHIIRAMRFPGGYHIGVEFGFCNEAFATFIAELDTEDDDQLQKLLERIQGAKITFAKA